MAVVARRQFQDGGCNMANNLWHDLATAVSGGALTIALAALVVALGAMAVSAASAATIVRRTAWQVAVVATLGFVLLELSGVGAASLTVVESVTARQSLPATQAESHHGEFNRSAEVPSPKTSPMTSPTVNDTEFVLSDDDWDALADAWIATRAESASESESEIAEPILATSDATRAAIPAESERGAVAAWPRWLPVTLAAVWLAGGLWFLARLMLAGRAMRALAGRLPPYVDHLERDDTDTSSDVRELAGVWGFSGAVRLVALPAGASPIAFGVWRPTIGLPSDFERRFTRPQRRAVLAHELAHLAAGDPLWRLLADGLAAALWWHPAAWLMRRRLIEASEAAADEASRALPSGAEQLAEALVVLGKRMARRRVGAVFGADGDFRSSLARRVERLLVECDEPWRPVSRGRLLAIRGACGVAAVVFVLCVANWGRTQLSSTQGESEMRTFAQTWRQSLCGVALAMLASGPATADDATNGVAEADANSVLVAFADDDEEEGEKEGEHEGRERGRGDRDGDDREAGGERRRDGEERERADRRERGEGEEREHRDGEHREGEHREREGAERNEARRREAQEIENRIRRIRGRLAELGDRESDERRELAHEAERLMHELRELAGGDRERREPDREGAERNEARRREAQEVENRIREIRNRIRELGDRQPDARRELAGEAERLMHELRELAGGDRDRREPDRPERDRPRGDRPDGDRPDGPGREQLEHLRAAIEHLRAAGMHDLAERLAREHEERNRRREGGDRPRPDRPEGDRPRPERPQPDRPRPERDRPDRPEGERRDGDRREGDRPRPDGERREGDRDRPDRPEGDRRDADQGREAAHRAAEELRHGLIRALEYAKLRADLQAHVEALRNELKAKEVELDRARELIEQRGSQ